MNGNVSELTSFDKNIKPSYLLEIPLNFWFNRHNGLAFPLVALQYQELNINVKFRKISECSYYENDSIIDINNNGNNYNLDELVSEDIIKLSGNLSVDYIFLDKNERKLFSNSQHEYLIEQVQFEYFNNIFNNNINVKLEFLHSCKEFIWVIQKNKYIKKNNENSHKLQWDNYSISDNYIGNPFLNSELTFNGYNRTIKMDGMYSNYLQPLIYQLGVQRME